MTYIKNIVNKSNRYNSLTSRSSVDVLDPKSKHYQLAYKSNYYQRLFCESKHALTVGAKVAMFTLTYNDKALPRYRGVAVHDFTHVSSMLVSLRKHLLNNYNISIRYFVTAEFGEGGETHKHELSLKNREAKRGKNANPHYHGMLYLYPNEGAKDISITELSYLVKVFWNPNYTKVKNKDNTVSYLLPWRYDDLAHGIAGVDGDWVKDFRASCYTAKYTEKDILKNEVDDLVRSRIFAYHYAEMDSHYNSIVNLKSFFVRELRILSSSAFDYIVNTCNSDFVPLTVFAINERSKRLFRNSSLLSCYERTEESQVAYNKCSLDIEKWYSLYLRRVYTQNALLEYKDYCKQHKARALASHHLGECGLNYIRDYSLSVPNNGVVEQKPLGSYLFRKFFYENPSQNKNLNGNPCYIPNQRYIDFKISKLQTNINAYVTKVRSTLEKVSSCEKLYNSFILPDLCPKFDELKFFITEYEHDFEKLALFNLVYKGRRYLGDAVISPESDYRTFLLSDKYAPHVLSSLQHDKVGVEYSLHPYFNGIVYLDFVYSHISQALSCYVVDYADEKYQVKKRSLQRINNLSHAYKTIPTRSAQAVGNGVSNLLRIGRRTDCNNFTSSEHFIFI